MLLSRFYGSTTGTTARVANEIAKAMGVADADVYDVATASPSAVGDYDLLIFGSSTWGNGDVQDDMMDFLTGVEVLDLKGKKIALFGCGDETMKDTFCSAVGEMHDRIAKTGASIIGDYNTIGYKFEHSTAVPEMAVEAEGLLIDETNHPDMTAGRVKAWTEMLKKEAEG